MCWKRENRTHTTTVSSVLFVAWVSLACGIASAQSGQTLSIRAFDSKSGLPIVRDGLEFEVFVDHNLYHLIPVKQDKDGVGRISLSAAVKEVNIFIANGKDGLYVNCDLEKHISMPTRWYPISEIVLTGIAAPNGCSKRKATPRPGEFDFFVRPPTFWEKYWD